MSYWVNVGTEREAIVLRPTGHLDVPAARHVLEMARLAAQTLRRTALIDLGGVHSATPGAAKLLASRDLARPRSAVRVRGGPGRASAAKAAGAMNSTLG